jgi:undecaprenyl-diphosphatase
MWFYHRGVSVFLFLATLLIGFARIAAGIHWPADVAGGLVIGIVTGIIVHHGYYALISSSKRMARR